MFNLQKKTIWAISLGILFVLIAILIVVNQKGKSVDTTVTPIPNSQPAPAPAPTPSPTEEIPPAPPVKLNYTDALKKYGDYRIQFDSTCQAHPNNVTYKAGTKVMFDNRAPVAHTINFNGSRYTIAKYDYIIVTMSAAKYPATVVLDCDKQQNVATILIQK